VFVVAGGTAEEEEDVKFEMFLLSSEVVVLVKLMMFFVCVFVDDDELNSSNEFMTKLDWILIDLEAFLLREKRERGGVMESDGGVKEQLRKSEDYFPTRLCYIFAFFWFFDNS
jgi:hypothetical protein